jgi:serine/threonine protein kinase
VYSIESSDHVTAANGQCPSCGRTFPRGGGHCPFDGTRIIALAPPPQDTLANRVLEDRYQLREPIATGTIGTTYRGWQISVSREVVIKVIHASYADREAEDRFLRAGGLAAQLVAPSIGNVYDVGRTDDNELYVVAELVRGRPLGEHVRQRLSLRRSVGIAMQLTDALAAAHALGIVHGDLKPGNLFVDDSTGRDTVKVVDFALARALDPAIAKPDPRRAPPLYLAPELHDGEPVSPLTDLYALGCIAFEMLTGAPPFTGATPDGIAAKHRREPPPALPPNVPAPLAALVQRLLAKSPRDRIASCADLRAKLEPILTSVGGPTTDLPRSSGSIPISNRSHDPTTPPTGPSSPTGPSHYRPYGQTTPPTGPSSPSHYNPYGQTTPPTGPSSPSHYNPYGQTTPPTGASIPPYGTGDPSASMPPYANPRNPSASMPPYGHATPPMPPARSRRLLVIMIVAIVTTAAGVAAVLSL